jgi:hypothetical protein
MNLKKFIRGLRTSPACAGDPSDWKRALFMIDYNEETLLACHQDGELPPGEWEYCQGIIELTIQGKRVAKTRKQWANYLIGLTRDAGTCLLGSPFRSDDSDTTKGMKLYTALLQLESFNKAHPEATLDELVEKINKRLWKL